MFKKKSTAFSLAEVLIGASILILISIGAYKLLSSSKKNSEITTKKVQTTRMSRAVMDALVKDIHRIKVFNNSINSYKCSPQWTAAPTKPDYYIYISEKFAKITGTLSGSGSVKIVFSFDGVAPATSKSKVTYEISKNDKTIKRNGFLLASNVEKFILSNDTNFKNGIEYASENESKLLVKVVVEDKFQNRKISHEEKQMVTSQGILSGIKKSSANINEIGNDF